MFFSFISRSIPQFDGLHHKGKHGRVLVVGGSEEYSGGPFFAASSSMHAGAELISMACSESAATSIKTYSPDLMVHGMIPSDSSLDWNSRVEVPLDNNRCPLVPLPSSNASTSGSANSGSADTAAADPELSQSLDSLCSQMRTNHIEHLYLPSSQVSSSSTLPLLHRHRFATRRLSLLLQRSNAVVVGPGLGRSRFSTLFAAEAIMLCLLNRTPLVIDADALRLLAWNPIINVLRSASSSLTPATSLSSTCTSSSCSSPSSSPPRSTSSPSSSTSSTSSSSSHSSSPSHTLPIIATPNHGEFSRLYQYCISHTQQGGNGSKSTTEQPSTSTLPTPTPLSLSMACRDRLRYAHPCPCLLPEKHNDPSSNQQGGQSAPTGNLTPEEQGNEEKTYDNYCTCPLWLVSGESVLECPTTKDAALVAQFLGGITILRKGAIEVITDSKHAIVIHPPEEDKVNGCLSAHTSKDNSQHSDNQDENALLSLGRQLAFEASGCPRRCGGQGDFNCGLCATWLHWLKDKAETRQSGKDNDGKVENSGWANVGYPIIAAAAGSLGTRMAAHRAFREKGRSMSVMDMMNHCRHVIDDLARL